ncbi:MAG: SH3 domain-containing protein [Pseudomonadota bacterium]
MLLRCLAALFILAPVAALANDAVRRGASGLPLPRFVSLSSGEVNVRVGPSFQHKVKFTFVKRGLPVEIVREYGNWRQVKDAVGEEGWVHHSLLSGRRTAIVAPWGAAEPIALRRTASGSARTDALLEPFVLAVVEECDGAWCAISSDRFSGHVRQTDLWGVYPTETVD